MKKEQQRKGKPRKGASACNPPDSLPFSPLSLRPGQIYYHTHKARRKQNTIYIKMEKKNRKRKYCKAPDRHEIKRNEAHTQGGHGS